MQSNDEEISMNLISKTQNIDFQKVRELLPKSDFFKVQSNSASTK